MNNDIVRRAAIELHSIDRRDVVKVATIVQTMKNWLKAFSDPAYKKKLEELKQLSPRLKTLVDQLSVEVDSLNKAITNTDPEEFGKSVEGIQPLISELSNELSVFDAAAEEATAQAPTKAVVDDKGNVYTEEEYLTHVEEGYKKDNEKMRLIRNQLPENLDVPISWRVMKPMQSFQWFQQFSPSDVRITTNAAERIFDFIKQALFNEGILTYEVDQVLNQNYSSILDEIKEGIINGTLISYQFPKSGVVNRMFMVVDAGNIQIPGTSIQIRMPTVFLNDKYTSVNPEKVLDLNAVKNIKVSSYDEGEFGGPGIITPEEEEAAEKEMVNDIEASRFDVFLKTAQEKLQYMDFAEQNVQSNIHEWARSVIQKAFYNVMGRQPTEQEIQTVQGVAHLESSYGRGWKGEGKGSNNWGAIQCPSCKVNGKCDPSRSFTYKDSSPQPDGTTKWYTMCFKKYPTPEAGAADLIKNIFLSKRPSIKGPQKGRTRGELVQEAVARGDLQGFSEAMYDTVYYEGTGKDRDTRVSRHMKAMERALDNMKKSTNREIAMNTQKQNQQQNKQQDQRQILDDSDARELFNFLYACGPIEKMVKRAIYEKRLPKTSVLISVGSKDVPIYYRTRFAKILSSALRKNLEADTSLHSYNDKIEIEADIYGSKDAVLKAAGGMCSGISEAFETCTDNKIKTSIFNDVKSKYALLDSDRMEEHFRKFAFDRSSK